VSDPSFALDAENLKQVDSVIQKYLPELPGFLPIDFGAMTFMVDSSSVTRAPESLEELLKSQWKKRFILEDPRTSSPGLQFLLYTKQVLGKRFGDFWSQLRTQWLAMPPGWDAAYGLFLKDEAPLVWSYVTSEAYHREHGSTRYRAALLNDGQPLQIEGALIVRGASDPELAHKFLNFLFSDRVQARIAATNWMWPARKAETLPAGFAELPKIVRPIFLSGTDSASVLKEWSEAIHR
jgi:thiamine transport system substrate-binding protein